MMHWKCCLPCANRLAIPHDKDNGMRFSHAFPESCPICGNECDGDWLVRTDYRFEIVNGNVVPEEPINPGSTAE